MNLSYIAFLYVYVYVFLALFYYLLVLPEGTFPAGTFLVIRP
jgi:hypothetical protein